MEAITNCSDSCQEISLDPTISSTSKKELSNLLMTGKDQENNVGVTLIEVKILSAGKFNLDMVKLKAEVSILSWLMVQDFVWMSKARDFKMELASLHGHAKVKPIRLGSLNLIIDLILHDHQ
eukprot:TRINITY_DN1524_c0_g1_i1.p2 TRINITY_DN1524_c0_g1~~TRINITY_DN1524_c0_g1_i1.p2  ORF type:complete len:122 (+),score=9.17 TRINITY_DN1524_c0_g1_i1:298-663(+)